MKLMLTLFTVFAFSGVATADYTVNYGWEGTETILGMYPEEGIIATIATNPVHSGTQSLCLEDNHPSGTPQAYLAWIVGLQDGDEVTGSFWRYDITPGSAPNCRISGHWNDDPDDLYGYDGSAGYNSDYGPGEGWDETSYTWSVETSGHTGLIIECRTYSNPGDTVWLDDMTITVPDHATIRTPAQTPIQRSTWANIKAVF